MENFLRVAWYIPVLLKMLFGNVIAPVLIKKVSDGLNLPKKITVTFFFCFIISLIVVVKMGSFTVNSMTFAILGMGLANAAANYASWRAQAINLSKMSLFVWLQPAIAMTLSAIFLGEHKHLSSTMLVGIALNLGAIILTSYSDFKKKDGETKVDARKNREFYISVLTCSFLFGLANFLYKCLTVKDVPMGQFLPSWYFGSFVGGVCLIWITSFRGTSKKIIGSEALTRMDYCFLALLGIIYVGNLGALYWSHFLAPQVVLFPLYVMGDKVIPILVGFVIFKEQKKYSRAQLAYLAIGVVGTLLIVKSGMLQK